MRGAVCVARRSALEAPAGRAVRLRRGDAEGNMEGEAIELPGRRSGARSAERSRERLAFHLGRPSTLTVQARRLLQRRLIGLSVTLVASPSRTRSIPSSLHDLVQAGLVARLRALRVSGPLVKYRSPSSQSAPIPAACGRPSGRDVPRKKVMSGVGDPPMSRSCGLLHGISADP